MWKEDALFPTCTHKCGRCELKKGQAEVLLGFPLPATCSHPGEGLSLRRMVPFRGSSLPFLTSEISAVFKVLCKAIVPDSLLEASQEPSFLLDAVLPYISSVLWDGRFKGINSLPSKSGRKWYNYPRKLRGSLWNPQEMAQALRGRSNEPKT